MSTIKTYILPTILNSPDPNLNLAKKLTIKYVHKYTTQYKTL